MSGKLFLIDGHALIFKMYYAFLGRPMVNTKGVDTSILFGFTKYLLELVQREAPTHLAVSFDPPGGTFRNRMYPAYKANRGETPQLVIDALEPLTAICRAMDIPVLMIPDFEADDVIGSMARRAAREGMEVYMVTPDKDYGQLVEEHIFQYKPGKSGADSEVLGVPEVCAKWGIDSPSQVIDILAICGDSSDNVPGVQGVGPVGASKLLRKYGSLEAVYAHLDELSPRQKEMFEAAADHIALSKQLVTIKTDIPLDVTAEDMVTDISLTPELKALFDQYEFNSLLRHIHPASGHAAPAETPARDLAYSIVPSLGKVGALAFNLVDGTLYLASADKVAKGSPEDFRALLEDESVVKYAFGAKAQMNVLSRSGISLKGRIYDAELMHYIANPERNHKLEALVKSYLGVELEPSEAPAQTASLFDDDSSSESAGGRDLALETVAVYHLSELLRAEMEKGGLAELYEKIEEPLISVLSRMEVTGVKVDIASLRDFASSLRSEMLRQEALVREISGEPGLNVSSPKQLGEVLFEKMKLDPKAKKPSKGSWPTDEATLQELADRSPIIDAILEYRGTRKLLSTYIEPFPSYISPGDGRVHTTFNQALTSTGRLSSSNPNLQNIPIRTEQGREIRKAFVPGSPDSVMMSADYSQIELRVMAHMCGDEHMKAAFRDGVDVHAATAAKIFHEDIADVTSNQRRVAKTANFGIMYGISAFGLAQRLGCPRSEAKQIIDDYFASFPSIRAFIDSTLASARENGYVQTIFGRRRYIPDINAHNANLRALAERHAVNAPLQGSAADILKHAMIAVDRRLREGGFSSKMVLQIHDELLLEVPSAEIEAVKALLVEEMEGVMKLSVPLTVECNYGKTWLEAH